MPICLFVSTSIVLVVVSGKISGQNFSCGVNYDFESYVSLKVSFLFHSKPPDSRVQGPCLRMGLEITRAPLKRDFSPFLIWKQFMQISHQPLIRNHSYLVYLYSDGLAFTPCLFAPAPR